MNKWFISRLSVESDKIKSDNSFCGKHELNEKKLTLYNKNNNKNYTFLYPKRAIDKYGYYVYRNVIPKYFRNIMIKEEK
jgi:hypothetical protein